MTDSIELFSEIYDAIAKLLFVGYIIILAVMGFLGFSGFTSPVYFISEFLMLILAFTIYKAKATGLTGFRVSWVTSTIVGFWGYAFDPVIGSIVALLLRAFMFRSMIF